ncbi:MULTISPECIES: helix-turn-helix domain-containing protein [Streptomyces]|uniref:XRE family transcriptional regulator n=2 Tax=Streptomyces TaxID=1883 RepID=A0A3S9PKQ5_STRLT|nr:helix-turn-helix transcriptional regulator [Streptomyces luteoverticillatus]AZQ72928.1 XRE family transcriptional regulator [Streptomyces luteoverticillatus]
MASTASPTLRQQRLGRELRKLRERAGLSTSAAAALLGVNQSRISNIEAGRYAVGADRVRAMARNYTCADRELVEALAGMTGGRTRGWWEEYREVLGAGLLDLAELEHHTSVMRVAGLMHIPGLLQTTDHARAMFNATVPPLEQYEVEHRVSFRVRRQAILAPGRLASLTAIIHESALRMGYGGSSTARAQLKYLIEMSERDNIKTLVVPFGSGFFPGSGQPIVYACGPLAQLDTVQLDADHGCQFLDAEAQLSRYRMVLDRMETCGLGPVESRDLIHRIGKEL